MPRPLAHLTLTKGDDTGRQFVMRAGQRFIVGRTSDCSIRFEDQMVSRHHAVLELTDRGLTVLDLGSRNGTKVDGKLLAPEHKVPLCSGDILQIGDHYLKINLQDIGKNQQHKINQTRRIPRNYLPSDEFKLLGEIGRGATGVVYGARHLALKRNVAIKMPREDISEQNYEDCLQRFVREGQLCCRIESPYVIDVYDLRIHNDRVFIVMELVNGFSALDRLRSAPNNHIPIVDILRIGTHIAQALHSMHRLKIIHRDIKPSNILLSPKGVAKLADFGIAKQLGEEGDELPRLTGSDEGMGTLGYVPPEIARFSEVGTYSDVYSLGATLYHLIAGTMPFATRGASMPTILGRISYEKPVPLSALRPDCPSKVIHIVEQMMGKQPQSRPHALDVSIRLDKMIEKLDSSPRRHHLERTDAFAPEAFVSSSEDLTDF